MNQDKMLIWVNSNMHMLEVLSPLDILISWEEYKMRVSPSIDDILLTCSTTGNEQVWFTRKEAKAIATLAKF